MGVTKRLSLELPIYTNKMKGWQVGFCLTLMSGLTLGRPSLLGASQRFPFFLNQQQRQGHSILGGHHGGRHEHHEHHHEEPLPESRALDTLYSAPPLEPLNGLYSAPAEEVVPLDGLYGAPPPPPPEPELPSYAEQPPPAPAPSAPEPVKAAAPMMMMDPSYNFEFSNEDSERSESNDINGVLKGSYSYKTPGGQDILVKYSAGAETGFVIENMDEVSAAIERSAAEPVAVKAQPYSGETAEVEFEGPGVDANMDLENNYRFGYKVSDRRSNRRLMLKVRSVEATATTWRMEERWRLDTLLVRMASELRTWMSLRPLSMRTLRVVMLLASMVLRLVPLMLLLLLLPRLLKSQPHLIMTTMNPMFMRK